MVVADRPRTRRTTLTRPVERPTSVVRTTRPDVFTFDSIRKPRVVLPSIDARRLGRRHDAATVRFNADIEVPLIDAAYLQKSFEGDLRSLECFVTLAIENGVAGKQLDWPLPQQELWVMISLTVALPLSAVREMDALTLDPELLAATVSLFIRREIQAKKDRVGAWAPVMTQDGTQTGFDLFREASR